MASLTDTLLDTPQPGTQRTITDNFWGASPQRHSLEAYWSFYFDQCMQALHDDGQHIQARTHQDVLEIVGFLRGGQPRDEIRHVLRQRFTKQHDNEDELVDNSIDLAAYLLLMIEFKDISYGVSGRSKLSWNGGSLQDCVASHFSILPALGHEGTKLPRTFNALNLERIAGVRVVPTSNLLDHLRLTHDDTRLLVFHYASFLKVQPQNSILPNSLVHETLNTFALLFPSDDLATRKWIRQTPANLTFDPQVVRCGYLKTDDRQIEKFEHWHDRLVVLKQVFDEATPRTLSQWWHDRRNGVQWYTFWVAIVVLSLTLFFGLVQSIEGALQVYGTFRGN